MNTLRTSQNVSLPSYPFEPSNESDSRQINRAVFLNTIADVRPHVVDDLWPIFWFYLFSVCERFKCELDIQQETDGARIYQALFERECRNTEKWQLVRNSARENWIWRVHFWALRAIHQLDREAVHKVFSTWSCLEPSALRTAIQKWSERWHINADWCREFGFAVIKQCLFHEGINESFLHPDNPGQNPFIDPPLGQTLVWHKDGSATIGDPNHWLKLIWVSAAVEALGHCWSSDNVANSVWPLNISERRECLKAVVFRGREPRRLKFDKFRTSGWNFLDESDLRFRRRASIEFRQYLVQEEKERLSALRARLSHPECRLTEDEYVCCLEWREPTLEQFGQRLQQYLAAINNRRNAAIEKHNLTEPPDKIKLQEHVKYAVLYQVPDKTQKRSTFREIADQVGLGETGVWKPIDQCLELIGLERPNNRGGRKPGSRNTVTSQILHNLGR